MNTYSQKFYDMTNSIKLKISLLRKKEVEFTKIGHNIHAVTSGIHEQTFNSVH